MIFAQIRILQIMNTVGQLKKKFKNKKILIVGLGLLGGGVGLAKFFAELKAEVIVTDKKNKKQLFQSINQLKHFPIKFRLGGHNIHDFLWADIVLKGPSVPWSLPELIEAKKRKIPIEMELSFFASLCPSKIIGITGTRGKSTTTNLIYQVIKEGGFNAYLGGRLPGISTIHLLKKTKPSDFVVLELSSWDLAGFHQKKLSPHIAVFTNFYPDHLNYYKNMKDYMLDKKAIYLYQTPDDYLIIHHSLSRYINKNKSGSKIVPFSIRDFPYPLKYLQGEHNQENAAAALRVADILELNPKKTTKIISDFKGLPYRQQIIANKNNIIFINDTTSTTPIATICAIETFQDKKIILILGGNSKRLPFNNLINQLIKIEKIVLIDGSFTKEALPILKEKYPEKISPVFDNLEKAVKEAYRLAKQIGNGNINICILFSPAATSFSMFKNEFHRGEEFNRIVKKVIGNS